MKKSFWMREATSFALMKKLFLAGVLGYSLITTFLLIKLKPEPILIGVDASGLRLIQDESDLLLRREKEFFLKRFLALLYNIDPKNHEVRVSKLGDLMTGSLWDLKSAEFRRIADQLKTEPLVQKAELLDLREVDDGHYQADLLLQVKKRLIESQVKLRVDLKVKRSKRTKQNTYTYEVENYEENEFS